MDQTDSRFAPSNEPASDDVASPPNLSPAEARAYWRGVADGLARAGSPVPPAVAERAAAPPADEPAPWDGDPPQPARRERHDAFSGARKQAYLKALAKTGCISDACALTGISASTVYNHQASDPDFARNCALALDMAATPIELTAYERAVVGVEEEVIRGGKVVGTRIKRSDYMLRVLLQGANPRKYGPRPGFRRKRLLKAERRQIEREVRAEMARPEFSFEEAMVELDKALDHFGHRDDARRREQGWTELDCGIWVPPGWVWTGEGDPAEAVARLQKKDDPVCNSSTSSISEAPGDAPPDLAPSPGIPANAGIHELGGPGPDAPASVDPGSGPG